MMPIPGFAGYEADRDGNIWSVASNWRGYGVRKLSQRDWKNGYLAVRLMLRPRKRHPYMVHKLVCLAFHGPKPKGKQCRHLDGVKTNNKPTNLQWGTPKENASDKRLHGTHRVGVQLSWTKLKPVDVRGIRNLLDEGKESVWIADLYDIHPSTVSQIKRKITWREVI